MCSSLYLYHSLMVLPSLPQDQQELLAICDMLEKKQLYQKAANLLCPVFQGDRSNEVLQKRWVELIAKTNQQCVGEYFAYDAL